MLHLLGNTWCPLNTSPGKEKVLKLRVKGLTKVMKSITQKDIATSSHALIVPVSVSVMRCSNPCDLEHRTELLISGQAKCAFATELRRRKGHNLFYDLPTATR